MSKMITRASSINRALDQIGDKWCLLIIQEVFWGVNSFTGMLSAMGISRGVLSDRLKWLRSIDCLRQTPDAGSKRMKYHLTPKSIDLYDNALMALNWEQAFFSIPAIEDITLTHNNCGHSFTPQLRCRHCNELVIMQDVSYKPGPGATRDERNKKVRRRSSIPMANVPSERTTYKNLINIVGDRWTANIIALSFHGLTRFDQFRQELPVATNILADRLKLLVEQGIFEQSAYQQRPVRNEYKLTEKGEATYPYFVTLLQWGDKWCDPTGDGKPMRLTHTSCGHALHAQVKCSKCGDKLKAQDVKFFRAASPTL